MSFRLIAKIVLAYWVAVLVFALYSAVWGGCTPRPSSWPAVIEPSDCAGACERLHALGCPGAEGSPGHDDKFGTADDVPCAEACRAIEAEGVTTLATACVARAGNCDDADACLAAQTE